MKTLNLKKNCQNNFNIMFLKLRLSTFKAQDF